MREARVNEGSLRDDLLSIPGVEGADIEGSPDKPAGLRIRIAEGADQHAVGGAIRRVLTSHGLGTDTKLPGEIDVLGGPTAVPDPADHEVADAPPAVEAAPGPTEAAVAVSDEPVALDDAEPSPGADTTAPIIDLTDRPLHDATPDVPSDRTEAGPGVARLASVSVEEGRDGIVVSVATTAGDRVRQVAGSTEGGVESAVVRATATLALPGSPEASVVDIEDRRIEGVDVVMIVLDVDGQMHAGSAVVAAGRAFALGRATWAALTL